MYYKKVAFNTKFILMALLLAFIATGCATYGQGVQKTIDSVRAKEYSKAELEIKKALKPDGKDRLLYYMELGSINRLSGEYGLSNEKFEMAEKIADELYTKKAADLLASMLLNPRQSPYPGKEFENIYLNYFKALNYMDLAQFSDKKEQRSSDFENAKIELRRLDFKLDSFEIAKGNYKEVEDKNKKTFVKLLNIFEKFQGNWIDKDWLKFREDAHARYVTGIIYEMTKDYDSARISYQKAAELYEKGYVKQYALDEEMIHLAWYDTIRMMIKDGGWESEWRSLASRKLSSVERKKLKKLSAKKCDVVVIEHVGLAPQRKELNLILKADAKKQSLYLYPIVTGDVQNRNDQRSWFFLLYSDKGVLDMVMNYSNGGLIDVAKGFQRKTIFLGPLWKTAEDISLVQAIGKEGVRVTVPYYSPLRYKYGETEVRAGYINKKLIRSECIGQLGLQNQLLFAGKDLNASLARASLKNIIGYQAGGQLGSLGLLTGKIAAAATSAAETRNWLMLPQEIKINRLSLDPGTHNIEIISRDKSGNIIDREIRTVTLKAGDVSVLVKRTITQ